MKMTKKKIFAISLIVCAIAILSMGTLAWFTAQDSVENKFMVGNTAVAPDEVFGLDGWETVDGIEIGRDTADDTGKTYMEILPGDKYNKVPVLENTGIHPQFVRATVTLTGASIWKETIGELRWYTWENFFEGKDDGQWVIDSTTYNPLNDSVVYVLYYQKILPDRAGAASITKQLFDTVKIPTSLTVEQAARLEDFTVSIYGEAIQSENLGVATAKEAFETYWEEATASQAPYVVADLELSGEVDPQTMGTAQNWTVIDGTWESDPTKEEALFTSAPSATNGAYFFAGGNYSMQSGDLLVKLEAGTGATVIYILEPISVNGIEVPKNELANYFDNSPVVSVIPMY